VQDLAKPGFASKVLIRSLLIESQSPHSCPAREPSLCEEGLSKPAGCLFFQCCFTKLFATNRVERSYNPFCLY